MSGNGPSEGELATATLEQEESQEHSVAARGSSLDEAFHPSPGISLEEEQYAQALGDRYPIKILQRMRFLRISHW